MAAYKEQGPDLWKQFNRGKDKKVWFEAEVLKMLKETWQHPLIDEYEKLIEQEKKLEDKNKKYAVYWVESKYSAITSSIEKEERVLVGKYDSKKEAEEKAKNYLEKNNDDPFEPISVWVSEEDETVKNLNQDNLIKDLYVYVVDTYQSEQDKKDHIEHEDYEVYLINNSDFDIEKVEMLVGGFTYQEEGTLETSKQLKDFGKLESKGKLLLEGLDMGMLDFVSWYNLDLFLDDGSCLKITFDFNYYSLRKENLGIAPVINIEAYPIKFNLRKNELFVKDTAKTINMDSQFVKSHS